jgi:predicted nucleic acid-binding protein
VASEFTVLFDACVLYPAPLRSFLMYLAVTDLFRAKWSDAIHDEWMRSVARDFPDIPPGKIERVRDLMNANVRDCIVTDFDELIPTLQLPDPDDRHVLAAAIRAGADVILTVNLRHFPLSELSKHGIQAQHPDEFIVYLLELAPEIVCSAANAHRAGLKNPPMDVADYFASLERQGLAETVSKLLQYADLL